jgi:hypothetical protein
MTTPQQPSGTSSTHRHTGAADPSVTRWLVDHASVVQAVAYLCAGGFVVGLLTGATTVAWLLLATALTADTASYGLRAHRARTHRDGAPPMTECGTQRNELHASSFHAAVTTMSHCGGLSTATTMTQIGDNRTHPLKERNQSSWRYRPIPHRR